jgi:hypothetical protein
MKMCNYITIIYVSNITCNSQLVSYAIGAIFMLC